MSLILFLYLSRHFLKAVAITSVIIGLTISGVELIEFVRKAPGASHVSLIAAFEVILSKLPYMLQEILPFLLFISAIYSFFQLSRYNEYTIIKTNGVSTLQFLLPYFSTSFAISILAITILNPIASVLLMHSNQAKHGNAVALLTSGLWLIDKTVEQDINVIVHADKLLIEPNKALLTNSSFTYFNNDYQFVKKLRAQEAILEQGQWRLSNATEYNVPAKTLQHSQYIISTNITLDELQNSFKDPRYISIWNLPYFISVLEQSGASTKQYVVYFYKVLSKPFLIFPILCIAACFALKPYRMANITHMALMSLLTVFGLYFITEMVFSIGLSSKILSPALTSLLFIMTINLIGIITLRYA
jgi:lipopolysaccharide export system permease protein